MSVSIHGCDTFSSCTFSGWVVSRAFSPVLSKFVIISSLYFVEKSMKGKLRKELEGEKS